MQKNFVQQKDRLINSSREAQSVYFGSVKDVASKLISELKQLVETCSFFGC